MLYYIQTNIFRICFQVQNLFRSPLGDKKGSFKLKNRNLVLSVFVIASRSCMEPYITTHKENLTFSGTNIQTRTIPLTCVNFCCLLYSLFKLYWFFLLNNSTGITFFVCTAVSVYLLLSCVLVCFSCPIQGWTYHIKTRQCNTTQIACLFLFLFGWKDGMSITEELQTKGLQMTSKFIFYLIETRSIKPLVFFARLLDFIN